MNVQSTVCDVGLLHCCGCRDGFVSRRWNYPIVQKVGFMQFKRHSWHRLRVLSSLRSYYSYS